MYYFFILLMTLFAYSLTKGLSTLNPFNIDWLLSGDYSNHLLGWLFYKNSAWNWPLTFFNGLIFPYGTSTVQIDSIPILALFVKALAPDSGGLFQYFGAWIFLAFFLNGVFAYKIFRELNLTQLKAFFGSFFITFSPIVMSRLGHAALISHWLILAMLLEIIRIPKRQKPNWIVIISLLIISSGVHPYLFVMVFSLALGIFADYFLKTKNFRALLLNLTAAAFAGWVLTSFWGYFTIKSPATGGFGEYNTDLLSPLNSMGMSSFIPRLRGSIEQAEGFCYLGLIGAFAVYKLISDIRKKKISIRILITQSHVTVSVLVIIAMYIFSLASPISFGGNSIISLNWFYNLLGPLPGIFRATGRFNWPLYYSTVIFLLYYFLSKPLKIRIWLIITALFAIEFFPVLLSRKEAGAPTTSFKEMLDKSPIRDLEIKKHQVVHLFPKFHEYVADACTPKDSFSREEYTTIALLVASKGGLISSGSTSRPSEELKDSCLHFAEELSSRVGKDDLLIIHANYWQNPGVDGLPKHSCQNLGHYKICLL